MCSGADVVRLSTVGRTGALEGRAGEMSPRAQGRGAIGSTCFVPRSGMIRSTHEEVMRSRTLYGWHNSRITRDSTPETYRHSVIILAPESRKAAARSIRERKARSIIAIIAHSKRDNCRPAVVAIKGAIRTDLNAALRKSVKSLAALTCEIEIDCRPVMDEAAAKDAAK